MIHNSCFHQFLQSRHSMMLLRATRSSMLSVHRPVLSRALFCTYRPTTPLGNAPLPYHLVVGLPALSPTMEVGTLAEWYVNEGDAFHAGDALAKIETDKAAMDFEAQDDGVVAKLLVPAGNGADIPISTPIMITVEDAADVAAFANYVSPEVVAPTPVVAAAAAAAVEPVVIPPPPKAAAPPPVPAAPTPPPPAVAVTPAPAAVTTAPVAVPLPTLSRTSPLFATLAAQQQQYVALYGATGFTPDQV